MESYKNPLLDKKNQQRAEAAKTLMKAQVKKPTSGTANVPSGTANVPQKKTGGWKDYVLPGVTGLATLGAGIADAYAQEDDFSGGGSIPSGSSPVGIDAQPVREPFSGRMKLSPEQRQSLALALLTRMV